MRYNIILKPTLLCWYNEKSEKGGIEYIVSNPTYVFHIEVVEIDSIWKKANLGHILMIDLQGKFDPIWEKANLGHILMIDLQGKFDPIWEKANLGHILMIDKPENYDPICENDNLGHISQHD